MNVPPGHEPNLAAARSALNTAVGSRIRMLRLEQSIGQAECAGIAGIDTSTMFRIEKGQQNATSETLARLALALDVEFHQFLIGVDLDTILLQTKTM